MNAGDVAGALKNPALRAHIGAYRRLLGLMADMPHEELCNAVFLHAKWKSGTYLIYVTRHHIVISDSQQTPERLSQACIMPRLGDESLRSKKYTWERLLAIAIDLLFRKLERNVGGSQLKLYEPNWAPGSLELAARHAFLPGITGDEVAVCFHNDGSDEYDGACRMGPWGQNFFEVTAPSAATQLSPAAWGVRLHLQHNVLSQRERRPFLRRSILAERVHEGVELRGYMETEELEAPQFLDLRVFVKLFSSSPQVYLPEGSQ